MISLILALSAAAPASSIQSIEAACRLASAQRISSGKTYSIYGTYFGATHGANIELPKCDGAIFPALVGNAEAAVGAWHAAYRAKCGVWLHGDYIRGVFTGSFMRRRLKVPLTNMSFMGELFVITDIASSDLDPKSIKCGPSEVVTGEH